MPMLIRESVNQGKKVFQSELTKVEVAGLLRSRYSLERVALARDGRYWVSARSWAGVSISGVMVTACSLATCSSSLICCSVYEPSAAARPGKAGLFRRKAAYWCCQLVWVPALRALSLKCNWKSLNLYQDISRT